MTFRRHQHRDHARRAGSITALLVVAGGLFPSPVAAANGELTRLAPTCKGGSSQATSYSNNRRLAMSAGGRQLAVYDPHGSGVQLSWKDAGSSSWSRQTRGEVSDGQLLGDDIANDRPASIVVDAAGASAWVVWGGYTFDKISEVRMRRLTDLDASNGPTVGPEVTLRPGGMGNVRVDAVYHEGSVYVSWTEQTDSTTYKLMVARLNDSSATPMLTDVAALWSGKPKVATGTFVATAEGLRLAARTNKLWIYSHISGASWTKGSGGASLNGKARPSAVALESGAILVAAQSDPSKQVVKVFRFTNSGNSAPEVEVLTGVGYAEPTLAHTGGDNALMVMVKDDDTVVSRTRTAGEWSASDTTELTAADSGNYEWPNALRNPTNGRLELLVSGASCSTSREQQEVLHLSRPLYTGPGPKSKSNVNIQHRTGPHRFKGRVASPNKSCERGRSVVIKHRRPGPDRTIGSDTTNANGKYIVRHRKTGKKKTYYARVRSNASCRADSSGNKRVR